MEVPSPNAQSDFLYWAGNSSGMFTLKRAYDMLSCGSPNPIYDSNVFTILWHLPIPPNWKAIFDRLFAGLNLTNRDVNLNHRCYKYSNHI